jgi:hypothetical protein
VGLGNGEIIKYGHDIDRDVLEAVGLGLMRFIARPVPSSIDQDEPLLVLERLDIAEFIPAFQAIPKSMLEDQRRTVALHLVMHAQPLTPHVWHPRSSS